MNAKAAFLHNTAASHRNIRVQLIAQALWPYRLPKIEESHIVGTVVSAVSCPYTTIIYLNIKPFVVVIGSEDRADWLAWGIPAMLT